MFKRITKGINRKNNLMLSFELLARSARVRGLYLVLGAPAGWCPVSSCRRSCRVQARSGTRGTAGRPPAARCTLEPDKASIRPKHAFKKVQNVWRLVSNDVNSPREELKRTGESGGPPAHTGTDPEPGGGIKTWTESCCLPHYNHTEKKTATIGSPLLFFAIVSAEGWGSCEDPSSPVPPCTSGWRTVRLQRQKATKPEPMSI